MCLLSTVRPIMSVTTMWHPSGKPSSESVTHPLAGLGLRRKGSLTGIAFMATGVRKARLKSGRPYPISSDGESASDPQARTESHRLPGVNAGNRCIKQAIIPAMIGQAREVPLVYLKRPSGLAERTLSPSAITSGLQWAVAVGPRSCTVDSSHCQHLWHIGRDIEMLGKSLAVVTG